ncbi:MAG: GAF domain-containing protein [Chloroflexota bacterium]
MNHEDPKTKEQLLSEIVHGRRHENVNPGLDDQTSSALWEGSALKKLYEITSQPALDSAAKVERLLEMGCQQLGLDTGIVSRIQDQLYEITDIYSLDKSINKGSIYLLSNTYCDETIQAKEPLFFMNVDQANLDRHPAFKSFGFEAYIGVAIMVDGKAYGTLNLSSRKPRTTEFNDAECALVRVMAQWIGADLERRGVEEVLALRAQELEALYDTSLAINTQPDLSTLLTTIVQRATGLLGTDKGGISLVNTEQDNLTVVAGHNRVNEEGDIPIRLGEGLAGRIAQSGEPMMVADYHHWDGRAASLADRPIGRILGVPLKRRDQVLGVLNVFDEKTGVFTEEDVSLLSLFAAQAAISIENARLFEANHQRAEQLETLRQVSLDLTFSHDLDALLQQIAERAVKLLQGDSGGINLYRPESDVLERVAAAGRAATLLGSRLVRGEGAAGTIWVTGQSLLIDDYQTWEGKSDQVDISGPTVGTPIQWGDEFLGALIIRRPLGQNRFTQEEASLLSQFATHAAIAIQNARLYKQAQDELVERKRAEELARASLREKEILLQEVNHRVKNNLQIVSSLLRVQARTIKDEQVRQVFVESQRRIDAMSLIHERLYKSDDLAQIDFATYIKDLATNLVDTYKIGSQVHLVADLAPIFLDLQRAIPCGLIINELVTNSLKYAFPNRPDGEIYVNLKAQDDQVVVLTVGDDGIGLPVEFDFQQTDSLGLQLVVLLTEQLSGQMTYAREQGTRFDIQFSLEKQHE